ncbi:hypothetical protein EBZ37_03980 [bacterium]|nr:hypothetical protein [bacterium]
MKRSWCTWVLVLILGACNDPELRYGTGPASFLELDAEVSEQEAADVNRAVGYLVEHPIEGESLRWYAEVFGATDSEAVSRFLMDRVRFILSQNTDIPSRVRILSFGALDRHDGPHQDDESGRGATNLATLWFLKKSVEPRELEFELNSRALSIDSTRIGIVQLGPAFQQAPALIQAGVLLHEARHSDCTGGLWRSDLQLWAEGLDPVGKACGHLHVRCPEGHVYEGVYACDSEPWGAYSINLFYYLALRDRCTNCSDEERILADAASIDTASRLLFSAQSMLSGSLGSPDMSHSTEVIER